MKLLNKRCGVRENSVVGIALSVFLLLFATHSTYAGSVYLDSGAGASTLDRFVYIYTRDLRPRLPISEGTTTSYVYSSFWTSAQLPREFLAQAVKPEVDADVLDFDLLDAAGVNILAMEKTSTAIEIRRMFDRYFVKCRH